MHYFRLHINDYAQATAHLSMVEDAAYTRLLRKYYADERPLPADIERLQRLIGARTREEKNAVKTVLQEFFFLDGEFFRNKRADAEIEEYQSKSLKAKESANVRWMRSHSDGTASAVNSQSDGNANHKPITNNQIKDKSARKRAVNKPNEVTDQTWEAFLVHRKSRRASITDVVIDQIASEARKAGISLDSAMRLMCARGWTGFEADWLNKSQPANAWVEQKERGNAAFRVLTGQQRSMSGDVIDIVEDKDDPFRLPFGN